MRDTKRGKASRGKVRYAVVGQGYISQVAVLPAFEHASAVKHEYVDGAVYARADERNRHHLITGNVLGSLHARLRGRGCRPYNSDTKIRIRLPTQTPRPGWDRPSPATQTR